MNAILNYLGDQATALVTRGTIYRDMTSDMGRIWLWIGLGQSTVIATVIYFNLPKVPKREQLPMAITLYVHFLIFLALFASFNSMGFALWGESSVFSMIVPTLLTPSFMIQLGCHNRFYKATLKNRVDNEDWSDEENRLFMTSLFRHNWYRWSPTSTGYSTLGQQEMC